MPYRCTCTDSCLDPGCWNQLIGGWVLFIYIFVDMPITDIHAILYRVRWPHHAVLL